MRSISGKRPWFIAVAALILGVLIGGYLFSDTKARSVLSLQNCERCFGSSEALGLVLSTGVQLSPGLVPNIVGESDKTLVIEHPFPSSQVHLVFIPKKDIQDVGDLTEEDQAYISDIFFQIAKVVQEKNLKDYQIVTNGPDRQGVNYLHFHLLAD